jgi:hypothetical protein
MSVGWGVSMSRKNKVNPAHYKVAGRLSPDDLARERMKQNARQDAPAWQERPGHAAAVEASVGPSDQDQSSGSGGDESTLSRSTSTAPSRGARRPGRSAVAARSVKRTVKTRRVNMGRRGKQPASKKRIPKTTARQKLSGKARTATKSKRSMRKSDTARATKKR